MQEWRATDLPALDPSGNSLMASSKYLHLIAHRPSVGIALWLVCSSLLPASFAESGNPVRQTPTESRDSVLRTDDIRKTKQQWQQIDNPLQDGWKTEAFSQAALAQLAIIGKYIEHPVPEDAIKLDAIASTSFKCSPLRPNNLKIIYQDGVFEVQRSDANSPDATPSTLFSGTDGLHKALDRLRPPFVDATSIHTKFKIYRVDVSGDDAVTKQYVEISGQLAKGHIEQHATWEAHWTNLNGSTPKLLSLDVLNYEQTRIQGTGGTLFTDCTSSLLEKNKCFAEQFQRGYGYWMLGVPYTRYQITEMMGHPGLAIADVLSFNPVPIRLPR